MNEPVRICYIPLDERPCNYSFPAMHFPGAPHAELITPPRELLGHKKKPADVEGLLSWFEDQLPKCDACVAAAETLLYGGLVPSRIHSLSAGEVDGRIARLEVILEANRHTPCYLFTLIMRTPTYDSCDEEPDYYGTHGSLLFSRSVLLDREQRGESIDNAELESRDRAIPQSYIDDYERRRTINRNAVRQFLELHARGLIDYLAIPMDDSSTYGYTAMDRRRIHEDLERKNLEETVPVYPGADETGTSLTTRALANLFARSPRVYPLLRTPAAQDTYPKYEGQRLGATIEDHIAVAGASVAASIEEADIVLAVNSDATIECEAADQPSCCGERDDQAQRDNRGERDNEGKQYDQGEPDKERARFASQIRELQEASYPVAFADITYANGGDLRMIRELDRANALPGLLSYAGWNTAGNTLGTTIGNAVVQYLFPEERRRIHTLYYRLLDDCVYQAILRPRLSNHVPNAQFTIALQRGLRQLQLQSLDTERVQILSARFPWNRLFEIDISLQLVGDE